MAAPALEDAGQALAWVRAERANVLACLDHVTREHQHVRVTALTAALTELLLRDGPWAEAITRHAIALQSARHLADQPSEASTLLHLGIVRRLAGDYQRAAADLELALITYRKLGDRRGQASALTYLAVVRLMTGDYQGAARDAEQGLAIYRDMGDGLGQASALSEIAVVGRLEAIHQPDAAERMKQAMVEALTTYRELGDQRGQANTLTYLGGMRRLMRDYHGAAGDLEQALAIYRDLGDRLGQAQALNETGILRRISGDPAKAQAHHQQALELARTLKHAAWAEAHALAGLGRCTAAVGHTIQAEFLLRQALEIFQRTSSSEVSDLLTEIGTLGKARAPAP